MIEQDVWYYVCDNRAEQKMVKITKNNKLRWRKQQVLPQELLGHPLNSVFRVEQQGKLVKEEKPDAFFFPHDNEDPTQNQQSDSENEVQEKDNESKDNRNLFDRNTSQKLTYQEILELKDNEDGEDIVKKLVTNSETFKLKTQYSQAKYLKKKVSKFMFNFCVQESSLDRVQKYWFSECPAKINFLRIDALALFLQLSGITEKSNILMFENTYGLALAGVLQRVNTSGHITTVFSPLNRNRLMDTLPFQQMNFSLELISKVNLIKADDINQQEEYSHILIAGEFNFKEIVENCKKQLISGGILTVYSSFLESLSDLSEYLMTTLVFGQAIIYDSFMRVQQVLPNRTHPLVEMNCFGGYILSAYKFD